MYTITTYCSGADFEAIAPTWKEHTTSRCSTASDVIINRTTANSLGISTEYGWWDAVRLHENVKLLAEKNEPIVHVDLDIILEKDIAPLVQLNHDIIISTEIGLTNSFPRECSGRLGFGVCSGFFIMKPTAMLFLQNLLSMMKHKVYKTLSDQVTIMNHIVNTPHTVSTENIQLEGITYTNKIIHIDGISICVLDYNLIVRDPMFKLHQYGNHINIGNVGGVHQFLKYFNTPLESLPLTCRCGKTQYGDYSVCVHAPLRSKYAPGSLTMSVYDPAGRIII